VEKAPTLVEVRPLTRSSSTTGATYSRDPGVEAQIEEALNLQPEELLEKASAGNTRDGAYLKEETLVYLIREHHRKGERRLVEGLAEALLSRSTPYIRGKLRTLGADRLEDAESEVVEMLFTRILDFESDRGDFFQVRYWAFLNRLLADEFRKQVGQLKKVKDDVAPDWIHGSEPSDDGEAGSHYVPPAHAGGLRQDQQVLLKEALGALDEPYRTLVVLRYYDGWPVESNDPEELTISKHFNKTPRTIRNWLAAADERLMEWREGKR
jgi:DNA-directed RNA polymerase specialized sigma24 family protein